MGEAHVAAGVLASDAPRVHWHSKGTSDAFRVHWREVLAMRRAYIAWQRAKDAATIVSSLLPTLGVSRVREVAVRGGPSFRIAQQGRNAGVGAVLWRSAPVLHQHMETQPTQFKDSTVLELGAGTGYVSFVASALGAAKVVATDAVAVEHPRRGAPTA